MPKNKAASLSPVTWIALILYLAGYVCIGYLLAVPTDQWHQMIFVGALVDGVVLAWAGSEAGSGIQRRSFAWAVLGATVLSVGLVVAVNAIGIKLAAGVVTGTLVWGMAWLAAIADEDAIPMVSLLVMVAIALWVFGSGEWAIGILFIFVSSTSPAMGERLGKYFSSSYIFCLGMAIAEIGLVLGWLLRRL